MMIGSDNGSDSRETGNEWSLNELSTHASESNEKSILWSIKVG